MQKYYRKQFCVIWFFIVRHPVNTPVAARKMAVPGVISSNIFSEIKTDLANVDDTDLKT
jgi:hypothetical protein